MAPHNQTDLGPHEVAMDAKNWLAALHSARGTLFRDRAGEDEIVVPTPDTPASGKQAATTLRQWLEERLESMFAFDPGMSVCD